MRQPSGQINSLLPVEACPATQMERSVLLVPPATRAAMRLVTPLERNAEAKSGRTAQNAPWDRLVTFVRMRQPSGQINSLLPVEACPATQMERTVLLVPPAIRAATRLVTPLEPSAEGNVGKMERCAVWALPVTIAAMDRRFGSVFLSLHAAVSK